MQATQRATNLGPPSLSPEGLGIIKGGTSTSPGEEPISNKTVPFHTAGEDDGDSRAALVQQTGTDLTSHRTVSTSSTASTSLEDSSAGLNQHNIAALSEAVALEHKDTRNSFLKSASNFFKQLFSSRTFSFSFPKSMAAKKTDAIADVLNASSESLKGKATANLNKLLLKEVGTEAGASAESNRLIRAAYGTRALESLDSNPTAALIDLKHAIPDYAFFGTQQDSIDEKKTALATQIKEFLLDTNTPQDAKNLVKIEILKGKCYSGMVEAAHDAVTGSSWSADASESVKHQPAEKESTLISGGENSAESSDTMAYSKAFEAKLEGKATRAQLDSLEARKNDSAAMERNVIERTAAFEAAKITLKKEMPQRFAIDQALKTLEGSTSPEAEAEALTLLKEQFGDEKSKTMLGHLKQAAAYQPKVTEAKRIFANANKSQREMPTKNGAQRAEQHRLTWRKEEEVYKGHIQKALDAGNVGKKGHDVKSTETTSIEETVVPSSTSTSTRVV